MAMQLVVLFGVLFHLFHKILRLRGERGREGGRERERERGRKGGRERGRERGREGGRWREVGGRKNQRKDGR